MAARHGVADGALVDWQARAKQAEQTLGDRQAQLDQLHQTQQAAAPMEQAYDMLSHALSLLVADLRSQSTLANLQTYVQELLHLYQQHPGLAQGEVGAQRRLRNLQQLQEMIARQQAAVFGPLPPAGASAPSPVM
jgi:serine phosphatase RsbU (regulator of sigma subunit)